MPAAAVYAALTKYRTLPAVMQGAFCISILEEARAQGADLVVKMLAAGVQEAFAQARTAGDGLPRAFCDAGMLPAAPPGAFGAW